MQVLYIQHANALEVKLNRPQALNALTRRMLVSIIERMSASAACTRNRLHIVMLTGAGDKVLRASVLQYPNAKQT